MSVRLLQLGIFFLASLAAHSQSQTQLSGDARVFSLDQCLKIALENSYEVRGAQATYQLQVASLNQSFGAYLPSLDANVGYSRSLNSTNTYNFGGQVITLPNSEPNSYTMGASASYLLFNGFSREANYSRAQQDVDAAELSLRRTRQSVSAGVRSAYLSVLKAMQVTKIRQENVELGKKEVERARALYEAGRTAVGTVYSQEADLGSREIDLISAQNAENQAKAQLLSAMAVPPDTRSEFLESSFAPSVEDKSLTDFRRDIGPYNNAIQSALTSRADYRAALLRIASAENGVRSAKGGYYPNVNASGGWSSSSANTFGENSRYYVAMNMNIPFFDNFSTTTAVQTARIQVTQKELDRALAEQKMRSEVQIAFLNLDAAEKQLDVSKRAVRSATQNFDATKERFAVGAATQLEYQTANQQLINARINQVSIVYSYYDAQVQLRSAIGTLAEN